MAEEKKFLGTAAVEQLITRTRAEISAAEQAAKKHADDLGVNYDAAGTAATKVNELAQGQVKTNKEAIGTMSDLETAAKGDLVKAINEVRNAVSVGGTAAAVTMEEKTTGLADGVSKAYVLKQGENTVGTINIPKDMVVQSGEVVVNPEGQAEGTYIKLTLANATNDIIYVNVGTLVDIYKAKANATQVQLAIDSASREISATIVAGSIGATELAANAVVTAKIADGNVTKAKLASDVQASLDKADAAAQDATDKAAQALADAKTYVDGKDTAMNTRVEALEAIDHDHSNKAKLDTYDKTQTELLAAAEATAKSYTDGKDSAMDTRVKALEGDHVTSSAFSQVKESVLALEGDHVTRDEYNSHEETLTDHDERIVALEAVTYVEITAAEVDAMFDA